MIEIVTLFLGLVTGPQTVQLAVATPAAAVEVELDGELVEWLTGAPWRLEVDLGEALADVRRALSRQRVVWLEGRHRPEDIELSPAARGIRLAGRQEI